MIKISTAYNAGILQTAMGLLSNGAAKEMCSRLLFDTGSSKTFITKETVKRLDLPTRDEQQIAVSAFVDSERTKKTYQRVKFVVKLSNGDSKEIVANVTERITCPLHVAPAHKQIARLTQFPLADPFLEDAREIDVLIGVDYYYQFVQPEKIPSLQV